VLGNFCQVTTAPIGGNGPTREERAWRTYNQLRGRRSCVTTASRFRRSSGAGSEDHSGAPARENVVFLFPVAARNISPPPQGPTLEPRAGQAGRPGAQPDRSPLRRVSLKPRAHSVRCCTCAADISTSRARSSWRAHRSTRTQQARAEPSQALAESGALTPRHPASRHELLARDVEMSAAHVAAPQLCALGLANSS